MRSNPERRPPHSFVWVLFGIALLSFGGYLIASRLYYQIGFPLDDAWIHQTYARNLAQHGEWAFLPGQPSSGSTSPLWSALLAIGQRLGLGPYIWTYFLGAVILWVMCVYAEIATRKILPGYQTRWPWAGTLFALEWHLVWAAGSGMETLLFATLVCLVLFSLITGRRNCFSLGLLIGLSVWVRPDGLTLLGPTLMAVLLIKEPWHDRLRRILDLSLGFGGPFILYLFFNLALSGSPWPNTFYAKQEEYAYLQQIPFWQRYGHEARQLLVGVGIVLLPGFFMAIYFSIRDRRWENILVILWVLGYLGLYAWKLPETYQHGRYVIPAVPVFLLVGFIGLVEVIDRGLLRKFHYISILWKVITGSILLIYWARGAFAYAQDVAIIESEMVITARWVAANLPPDALVAAHDIGALGYFGDHELVDLAGLVTPEVVPFLRNEDQIAVYLDERNVDYLVTFPDWYPSLVRDRDLVFVTGSPYAPSFGEKNMAVYRWREP